MATRKKFSNSNFPLIWKAPAAVGIEPSTVGAHLLLILVVTAAYIIIPWQAASILKAASRDEESGENGAGYGAMMGHGINHHGRCVLVDGLEHVFFHIFGNVIIPTDFHMF